MLSAVLHRTDLSFVWLDSKPTVPVSLLREAQRRFADSAAALGRNVRIVNGLPTAEKVAEFEQLPDFKAAFALCELSVEEALRIKADIWAPRWTLGTQSDAVAQIHAARLCAHLSGRSTIQCISAASLPDGLVRRHPYELSIGPSPITTMCVNIAPY